MAPGPARHKVCLFHRAVLWVNPFPAAFFLSGARLRGFMDGGGEAGAGPIDLQEL